MKYKKIIFFGIVVYVVFLFTTSCFMPFRKKKIKIDLSTLQKIQVSEDTIRKIKARATYNDNVKVDQSVVLGETVNLFFYKQYNHYEDRDALIFSAEVTLDNRSYSPFNLYQHEMVSQYRDCLVSDNNCLIKLKEDRSGVDSLCQQIGYSKKVNIDLGSGLLVNTLIDTDFPYEKTFDKIADRLNKLNQVNDCDLAQNLGLQKSSNNNDSDFSIVKLNTSMKKKAYSESFHLNVDIVGVANTTDIIRVEIEDQYGNHMTGFSFTIPYLKCNGSLYKFEKRISLSPNLGLLRNKGKNDELTIKFMKLDESTLDEIKATYPNLDVNRDKTNGWGKLVYEQKILININNN